MSASPQAVALPVALPRKGDIIAGKYRVEDILGAGGMGVVVAAYHLELNQHVAIKLLRPEIGQEKEAMLRFQREARITASLKSEHVVRVYDVARLDNGAPYMVMEHLYGEDLGEVLSLRGPLPVIDAAEYLLQACEAIAEAHARNLVHRDLKPGNLFLSHHPDGSPLVKVLDFGISKSLLRAEDPGGLNTLTASMEALGSPQYMSPEQIRSSRYVDHRTDIWALGVILHRLLSGQLPFVADTMLGVALMITSDPPLPLRAHRPGAPVELESLILRCLEKDAAQRPESVEAFAEALLPFAPRKGVISVDRIRRVLAGAESSSQPRLPAPSPNELVGTPPVPSEVASTRAGVYAPTVDEAPMRTAHNRSRTWPLVLVVGLVLSLGMTQVIAKLSSSQPASAPPPVTSAATGAPAAEPTEAASPKAPAQPTQLAQPAHPAPGTEDIVKVAANAAGPSRRRPPKASSPHPNVAPSAAPAASAPAVAPRRKVRGPLVDTL